jgi:hypothetical protein
LNPSPAPSLRTPQESKSPATLLHGNTRIAPPRNERAPISSDQYPFRFCAMLSSHLSLANARASARAAPVEFLQRWIRLAPRSWTAQVSFRSRAISMLLFCEFRAPTADICPSRRPVVGRR